MSETALQVQGEAFSLAPKNLEQAMSYAKLMAESSVVPVAFQKKPADILIAVQLGMELGFSPVQALQSICVINGRPCVWGQGVAAKIISSPLCEYLNLPSTDDIRSTRKATVVAKRRGHAEVIGSFDDADAKTSGLTQKDTYVKWWPDMYLWRAFHRATKITFADVMKGMIPREIMDDFEHVGETPEGHAIMRRPKAVVTPVDDEKQIAEFLNDKPKAAAGHPDTTAPLRGKGQETAAAPPDLERVGVIKAEDGTTKKGAPMLKLTLARTDGKTVEAFAFSSHVMDALRRAHGEGLACAVKVEQKGKSDKPYLDVTEAVCEEPGGEQEPV